MNEMLNTLGKNARNAEVSIEKSFRKMRKMRCFLRLQRH